MTENHLYLLINLHSFIVDDLEQETITAHCSKDFKDEIAKFSAPNLSSNKKLASNKSPETTPKKPKKPLRTNRKRKMSNTTDPPSIKLEKLRDDFTGFDEVGTFLQFILYFY